MPSPNLPQGITDPLNTAIQETACLSLTAYNTVGGIQGVALPDARSDDKATAEWRNTVAAMLRSFCDYVQGLTPVTALEIATYFRVPVFTTAARPVVDLNDGRLLLDSDLDRLVLRAGGAWTTIPNTDDLGGGVIVFAEGGAIDDTFGTLQLDDDDFVVVDNGDGSVSIAIGEITFSDLPDGSARSLLGRAANSSGVLANIAGAGADTVAHDDGSTVAFRSLDLSMIGDRFLIDTDLSTLANNTFADGTESIDGRDWTAANVASATTFDILNGTGLRAIATAITAYTTTTRDAPYLRIALSSIAGWDPLRTYVFDCYYSTLTLGSGARVLAAFDNDNAGTDRLLGGGRRNSAGTQETYSQADSGLNGSASTDDAFGVRADCRGVATFSGTYAAGFPLYTKSGGSIATANGVVSAFDGDGFLVLAFCGAAAGLTVTLRHMRLRMIA